MLAMSLATKKLVGLLRSMKNFRIIRRDDFMVEVFIVSAEPPKDIISLKKAIENKLLFVVDTEEVNKVVVENKSDRFVLLNRGDVLVGGKQNRTILTPIVIPPRITFEIPVDCVEAGRWRITTTGEVIIGLRRAHFAKTRRLPMYLRAKLLSKEIKFFSRIEYFADATGQGQSEIWRDINESSEELSAISETSDVTEILRHVGTDIDPDLKGITKRCRAAIYYYRGRIIALEIYLLDDAREILVDNIRGAYADYLYYERKRIKTPEGARNLEELLDELKKSKIRESQRIGAKRILNIETKHYVGQLVEVDGKPVVLEIKLRVGE